MQPNTATAVAVALALDGAWQSLVNEIFYNEQWRRRTGWFRSISSQRAVRSIFAVGAVRSVVYWSQVSDKLMVMIWITADNG